MFYVGVTILKGEGAILGDSMCPTSLIPLKIENWTGPCSGIRQGQGQTLDCKHWASLLSAAKWGIGLHMAGEV